MHQDHFNTNLCILVFNSEMECVDFFLMFCSSSVPCTLFHIVLFHLYSQWIAISGTSRSAPLPLFLVSPHIGATLSFYWSDPNCLIADLFVPFQREQIRYHRSTWYRYQFKIEEKSTVLFTLQWYLYYRSTLMVTHMLIKTDCVFFSLIF